MVELGEGQEEALRRFGLREKTDTDLTSDELRLSRSLTAGQVSTPSLGGGTKMWTQKCGHNGHNNVDTVMRTQLCGYNIEDTIMWTQ